MGARKAPHDSDALYQSEAEIAQRVLGGRAKDWPHLAIIWEREGLPTIDPFTGMRFWPAVDQFFRSRHGLSSWHVPAQADGVETW
jgi:hypothetical protein